MAATAETHEARTQRTAMVAGMIGNLLEWYDWAIYGFFAAFITTKFFPSKVPPLLSMALIVGARFFVWPVGALVFGPYGDRRGRRAVLAATIALMGLGSLVIGILPGYQRIGILAPILLVSARLLQGLSAGGEFGGAAAFLVEHAPRGERGYAASFQQSGMVVGVLLATGIGSLMTALLPHSGLAAWGWRIPFVLGGVVGAFGLSLRLWVEETPAFRSLEQAQRIARMPLDELFAKYPAEILRILGMALPGTLVYYVWVVYMPTLGAVVLQLPLSSTISANTISLGLLALLIPFIGMWSDRIGRKPLLAAFAIGVAVWTYPLFLLLRRPTFGAFLGAEIVGVALFSLFAGTIGAAMAERYPAEVRCSGIGVPYGLAVALFGGTVPLLTAYLMGATKTYLAISYPVIVAALIGALVYVVMPETYRKPLT